MSAGPDKFTSEDLPKILTAVKEAREAGMNSQVVVSVAANGGIISVIRKSEKNYKG